MFCQACQYPGFKCLGTSNPLPRDRSFQDDKLEKMGVAESTVHNEQPYFWPFQDATSAKDEVRRSSLASDKVDVLIIGAGPSG